MIKIQKNHILIIYLLFIILFLLNKNPNFMGYFIYVRAIGKSLTHKWEGERLRRTTVYIGAGARHLVTN